MKFRFENLGPLAIGELSLADLTVICGENNTGKTYLTYTLYGFLKTWENYLTIPVPNFEQLDDNGVMEVNLQDRVISRANTLINSAAARYRANLHTVTASQESRFLDTKLHVELDFSNLLEREYKSEFTSQIGRAIIVFSKTVKSPILTINAAVNSPNNSVARRDVAIPYRNFYNRVVREICFAPAIPKPFIVSTERTGVATFQADLNLAKNRLFELAHQVTGVNAITPHQLTAMLSRSYPLPVRDNVEFITSLNAIQKQGSELLREHPDIFEDFENLIGGTYKLQNNVPQFIPKGVRGVRLDMGESSSAVRSLVILGYYLKHRAAPGDLLMIDEPELNLHPANQRKLARLLVRLVNAGIRVFITTHSDYIVKEFNTLVMLNTHPERLKLLKENSRYTEKDRLDPGRMRVYMLSEDWAVKSGGKRKTRVPTLCEADISPTLGAEVRSFDETIEEMSEVQESLYYGND